MLSPKAGRARIEVLDVIRGVAIVLIFFFNLPTMGNSNYEHFGAIRLLGWSPADQICWWFLRVFLEGTQRGMLQILFGAGALIILERTLEPGGPVDPADLYFRRNLWLALFGLFDIFALLWFGDILLAYATAAMFLFPFRKLSAATLLAVAMLFAAGTTMKGSISYREHIQMKASAARARDLQNQHLPLSLSDRNALDGQEKALALYHPPASALQTERDARLGTLAVYVSFMHGIWTKYLIRGGGLWDEIVYSFFSMLLGMALFKFGITQGRRTIRFYLCLALFCYCIGLPERIIAAWQLAASPGLNNIDAIGGEPARLLVSVGHVAFINCLFKTSVGRKLLSPFRAPGRMAFSLYLLQNLLGDWILFPAVGFGLWGRYGWVGLTLIGLALLVFQLILANVWLRQFAAGPLEWVWRSVAYQRRQPFRRRATLSEAGVG